MSEFGRGFDDFDTGILGMFAEQVPLLLEDLDGALTMGRLEQVRAQAHKLKGTMFAMSATRAAWLADELQRMAERSDLTRGDSVFEQLLHEFMTLEEQIKQELSRRHPDR
jgi:HPt (histidine-containing phosphotransfer) domain-containing protein